MAEAPEKARFKSTMVLSMIQSALQPSFCYLFLDNVPVPVGMACRCPSPPTGQGCCCEAKNNVDTGPIAQTMGEKPHPFVGGILSGKEKKGSGVPPKLRLGKLRTLRLRIPHWPRAADQHPHSVGCCGQPRLRTWMSSPLLGNLPS